MGEGLGECMVGWEITNIFRKFRQMYFSNWRNAFCLLRGFKECILKGSKKPLNGCMAQWEDCEAYLGKLQIYLGI